MAVSHLKRVTLVQHFSNDKIRHLNPAWRLGEASLPLLYKPPWHYVHMNHFTNPRCSAPSPSFRPNEGSYSSRKLVSPICASHPSCSSR